MPKLEGSEHAPVLVFDEVPVFGLVGSFGRITLTAYVHDIDEGGQPFSRHVAVAHLRASSEALQALSKAVDGLALLLSKTEGSVAQVN
ncbi:hypothetical protein ASG52_03680 [Methylobacterium sp. Leaf456]|nr:hypothetical protein ASG52_03680 [Methylobacterium sp. Leaf456]